jgi:hypothetical protein
MTCTFSKTSIIKKKLYNWSAYLLQTGDLEIGQMRKPDLFAWGQINENDPPWQGTDDRVRVIVLEKMSSNLY